MTPKRKPISDNECICLPFYSFSWAVASRRLMVVFLAKGKKNTTYHLVRDPIIAGNFSLWFLVFQNTA
jgi:hypothetical protein